MYQHLRRRAKASIDCGDRTGGFRSNQPSGQAAEKLESVAAIPHLMME